MYSPRGLAVMKHAPSHPRNAWARLLSASWMQVMLTLCTVALLAKIYKVQIVINASQPDITSCRGFGAQTDASSVPVLVSYSYFEKDPIQLANMEFFVAVGMGFSTGFERPPSTDFVVVISGDMCSPCSMLQPHVTVDTRYSLLPGLASAYTGAGVTMLQRTENEGMDIAAHNVTIEWTKVTRTASKYRYFIFLNSSVRGPFWPAYMPPGWSWPRAFTDRLRGRVKVVSSSLVCLPDVDEGGPGPKVESWAFGADEEALDILTRAGVFDLRECKLCPDGIVVKGEYGISAAIMRAGYNIGTLMAMYPHGVEWAEDRHWRCNNNAHPSRHGTYDGISMHPFETVFIKASWHVGEPHLSHYTRWFLAHAKGSSNTDGYFAEPLYRWAIQPEAQEPNNAGECYKVPPALQAAAR